MRKILHHLFVASALLAASASHAAFYVNADVKGDQVRWDNVTYGNGAMVPSQWGVPPALRTATAWVAASLPVAPATSIILKGGSGNETSAAIPLAITGVQYNSTGVDLTESSSGMGGGCTTDQVTLPIVTVDGIGCVSSTRLSTSTPSSPFILFRPMFNIEASNITSALSGLSQGIYSAVVPITVRYYFENTSGIMTFRNINDVMIFSFNYDPVQLEDISVIGDGIMEPEYNTDSRRIDSSTRFTITASGYFTNGLVLTMPRQPYALTHTEQPVNTVPYSVTCNECSETTLVSEGDLRAPVTTIGQNTGAQTSIQFNLDFSYDVEGEPLISGEYQDSVTFVLEAGI